MQDFLRDEDPLSRTERKRVRDCDSGPATVSIEQIRPSRLAVIGSTTVAVRSDLQSARKCLSTRENRVIALLFDRGWNSREVADDLGVNESRVSQIKRRAIANFVFNWSRIRFRGPNDAALPLFDQVQTPE